MKLLAVSFAFPPMVAPRSIQVARLLRHVDAEVALVCADDASELSDPSLEPGAEEALAICRRVPFSRTLLRRRVDVVASRLNLPFWNRRPDAYRRFIAPAVAAAEDIVRSGFRPDALVTFGNPMSDHLIGQQLAPRLRLPWAAHFSDPWTDNPYHHLDPLERWLNRRQEAGVMAAADLLLFPSAECQTYMLRNAPDAWHAKSGVLPHSFDATVAASTPPPEPGDPVTVRHIGTMYGRRNIKHMVTALGRVSAANPARLDGMRFEFVGISDPLSFAGEELARLPAGLFTTRPRVSYLESLSLMAQSDGLLLLDGVWDGPGIFFPAKLADYIGSGQPILGIAAPGAAAGIIERLGGPVAAVHDAGDIAAKLGAFADLLRERRRARAGDWGCPGERARYAAPNVARLFRDQLARLPAA